MSLKAEDVLSVLKAHIKNFEQGVDVGHVGRLLSLGDGIATVWGLENIQFGEMVVF